MEKYYHIDKSGQIESQFMQIGQKPQLLIGDLNRNAFPEGIIRNKKKIVENGKISEALLDLIISFFENTTLDKIDKLITELASNSYSESDLFIQRIIREIIFEKIRLKNFSQKPSRLRCIYLIDNKDEINQWHEMLGTNSSNSVVYTLVPTVKKEYRFSNGAIVNEKLHKADSKLLEIGISDLKLVERNAIDYWEGVMTSTPLFETLFYGGLEKLTNNKNE